MKLDLKYLWPQWLDCHKIKAGSKPGHLSVNQNQKYSKSRLEGCQRVHLWDGVQVVVPMAAKKKCEIRFNFDLKYLCTPWLDCHKTKTGRKPGHLSVDWAKEQFQKWSGRVWSSPILFRTPGRWKDGRQKWAKFDYNLTSNISGLCRWNVTNTKLVDSLDNYLLIEPKNKFKSRREGCDRVQFWSGVQFASSKDGGRKWAKFDYTLTSNISGLRGWNVTNP